MPKYQVTLTYLITVDASDEDGAELMAVSEVSSDPTCFNDIEVEEVKITRGLRAEMNVLDDPILPKFDENDPDTECIYQTWKNTMKNSIDKCITTTKEVYRKENK